MPAHPSGDHLAALAARLAAELAAERRTRAADRVAAGHTREALERELAAAVRAAGVAERERDSLLQLLIHQERRLLARDVAPTGALRARPQQRLKALAGWLGRAAMLRSAAPEGAGVEGASTTPHILLACVVGLDRAELAVVIETVRANLARAMARPVFITDRLEFDLFRIAGVACEPLPSPADVVPALDAEGWRLYVVRRLALLVEKWQATAVVPYGEAAAHLLGELAAEPLLPPRLRALLGASGKQGTVERPPPANSVAP